MGQRGSKAAFMPNKFVFPGGAVDTADSAIRLAQPLTDRCHANLQQDSTGPAPETLAVAAIRELWEETGLMLGALEAWPDAPKTGQILPKPGFAPQPQICISFFAQSLPRAHPDALMRDFFWSMPISYQVIWTISPMLLMNYRICNGSV